MEYQKIKNLLDNTSNQPSKSRTKYWVKIIMIQEERVTKLVVMNTYLLKKE